MKEVVFMSQQSVSNPSAPQDEVQYRRSPMWRIALAQMNGGASNCFYILMGYISYVAGPGYGIATAVVGLILTFARIFDAITDPLVALALDKLNTKHGKIRYMIGLGWLIEALSVKFLFDWSASKGHGIVLFVGIYLLYIIGYTMQNVTGQIIGPVLTNDPKQRPKVGVWATIFQYVVPTLITLLVNLVLLPKYGNEFSLSMLAETSNIVLLISFVMVVLVMIGVSAADKPENFRGIAAGKQHVSLKDMKEVLTGNRPLQMYIVAAASDKIAQSVAGQAIIGTMLFGIIIGNMQISTIMQGIAILAGIAFAMVGAKYAGNHGNKETVSLWAKVCIIIAALNIAFFFLVDTRSIAKIGVTMVIFLILQIALNGSKMCITTANGGMMADVVDWQLEKSGKYIPGIISATYSILDKLISSFGGAIATGAVALIGYTTTMPQPNDELTETVLMMTMILYYGLPMLGWVLSVIAMKFSPLSKEKMVEVQKSIAEKKAALIKEGAN